MTILCDFTPPAVDHGVPDDDEGEECGTCAWLDYLGRPCGAPWCRLRCAWRRWRHG